MAAIHESSLRSEQPRPCDDISEARDDLGRIGDAKFDAWRLITGP
jgi:hypothetical protein